MGLSQTARILADACLVAFAVKRSAGPEGVPLVDTEATLWFFLGPLMILAWLYGVFVNYVPRRWVLVGAASFSLGVTALAALLDGPWPWVVGPVAIGSAFFGPAAFALLPNAVAAARASFCRVVSVLEVSRWAALPAAVVLIWGLDGWGGVPSVGWPLALYLVALLTALPVALPGDLPRRQPLRTAAAGFILDRMKIAAHPEAAASRWGLFFSWAMLFIAARIILYADDRAGFVRDLFLLGSGLAGGAVLAGVQGHPRRLLGLVPYAAALIPPVLVWAVLSDWAPASIVLLGFLVSLLLVPLRAAHQIALPPDLTDNGQAALNFALGIVWLSASFLISPLRVPPAGQWVLLGILALAGAVWSWWRFFREAFEQILEIILWPMYRIWAHGPGKHRFPLHGPVVVVANHAAWLDPLFLGKVLPRRLYAMMTSVFYDLPGLRWVMRGVFQAIRVQASTYRHYVPELEEGLAVIQRGDVLVIFPEGWMRRTAEKPLRQFGQGVWHILRQRPQTPVVVCWIEGNFGSYMSYFNGPPTKNKRLDFWRRIDVAIREPEVLPAEVLADHRTTRQYLMQACLDSRRFLGLEVHSMPTLAEESAAEEEDKV